MVKPGYKQTEIGVIPEDWKIRFLPFFGDVVSGGTPSTNISAYWNGDIAWCTPSDITSTAGTRIIETEKRITALGLSKSAATLLPPGSLLLCTRATIGDAKINSVPMATNQGFKNIVPKNCNIFFLYYLLQTKKKEMLEKAIGSTFLEISKSSLCSIPLQYPQLPEQDRIAEALSDMDELIASLEKLIAKKKAIKQGAMQELLTGKRRLPGFSGEWREVPIGEWGYLTKESVNPQLYPAEFFWEYSMPAYDEDEKPVKQVGKNMHSNRTRIKGTVLLFNKLNVRQRRIWYVENCGSNAVCSSEFLAYCSEKIDLRLVKYILGTDTATSDFVGMSTGTSNSQKRITPDCFLEYKISIPVEIKEQNAIADILENMDKECSVLEDKLEKTRQIKQGMMQQLLTGKIRLLRSTIGGK